MPGAPEELYLGDESDATRSSGGLDAEAPMHVWLDGAALGLCERGSNSCIRVLKASVQRPTEDVVISP